MKRILFLWLLIIPFYGCGVILHSPGEQTAENVVEEPSRSNPSNPVETIPVETIEEESRSEDRPKNLAFWSGKSNQSKIKERVVLLSTKYQVEEGKVEGILEDYFSTHNPLKSNPNFKETLTQLSTKYSVPMEKVAGLVIDYKDWLACGGA